MAPEDAVLVRVLAAADALLLPVRDWTGPAAANRYTRSRAAGVPYRANTGADDAGRKAGERVLMSLADDGLLAIARGSRVKFPLVRLSASGEARARALCGLPGRDVGRLWLAKLVEQSRLYVPSPPYCGVVGRWVPEVDFSGPGSRPEDTRELAATELDALPSLAAGWAVAHSTWVGAGGYCATPAGIAEAETPTTDPDHGTAPAFDPEAATLYRAEQDARLLSLASDDPAPASEIGFHPLAPNAFLTVAAAHKLARRRKAAT